MDKKALTLNLLVVVTLSLFIFVFLIAKPTYTIYNNLVGGDISKNFFNFVDKVKEAQEEGDGTKKTFMLSFPKKKSAEGLIIAGFNQGVDKVETCFSIEKGNTESYPYTKYCAEWPKPSVEECKKSSCLCLIKGISPPNWVYVQAGVIPVGKQGMEEPQVEVPYNLAVCESVENVMFGVSPFIYIEEYCVADQYREDKFKGMIFETYSFVDTDAEECKVARGPLVLSETRGYREFEFYNQGGFVLGRLGNTGVQYRVMKSFNFDVDLSLIYLVNKENKIMICFDGECKYRYGIIPKYERGIEKLYNYPELFGEGTGAKELVSEAVSAVKK